MSQTPQDILLDAILPHVPFDGWSRAAFEAARADAEMSRAEADAAAPRGALDLAIAFHRRGDIAMVEGMKTSNLSEMKIREKVSSALRLRLDVMADHREAVRRASALFALPQHAPDGAKLIWETADQVWTAMGDTSRDVNWYTKRATLSGVWASVVLYWLGDETPGAADTTAFIDRRIDDVMRIEKIKAQVRDNPITKPIAQMASQMMSRVKAPDPTRTDGLPGRMTRLR